VRRRNGSPTHWLVQEFRTFPFVERWILDALATEVARGLAIYDLDYRTCDVAEFMAAFGRPEVVVSSRYHGTLLAAWHGSRVLVIARSDKLRGIANELNLPTVDAFASCDEIETAVAGAVPVPLASLHSLQSRAQAMCDAFFSAIRTQVNANVSWRAGQRTRQVSVKPGEVEASEPFYGPEPAERRDLMGCAIDSRSRVRRNGPRATPPTRSALRAVRFRRAKSVNTISISTAKSSRTRVPMHGVSFRRAARALNGALDLRARCLLLRLHRPKY